MGTKREFKWFTITQHEEEGEYLSDMHRHGWKLSKVSFPGFYYFEECEPEEYIYQLDYNQDSVKNRGEYLTMFRDCGWDYMFDFVGYSYFRKPKSQMDGDEKIFCDDESRLDMLKRVFMGRVIPLVILFFCVIIPQLMLNLTGAYNSSFEVRNWLVAVFTVLFLIYLILFATFGSQYFAFERKVKGEENFNKWKYYIFMAVIVIIALVVIGLVFYAATRGFMVF